MNRSRVLMISCASAALAISWPGIASETQKFTYDAKGRVVKVERSGTVNNGVKSEYEHDKANNRKRTKITGSANPPPT